MFKTGTYVRNDIGDTFIYIDDIYNEEDIINIKKYFKKYMNLDYEHSYNINCDKIYFKCTNFKTATDTKRYSFYISNGEYLLIQYTIYDMIFKIVNIKEFIKNYTKICED